MNNTLTDMIVYSSLVAAVMVLTKPGSQGPGLVKNLFSGYTRVVQAETGQSVTG